MPNLHHFFGLFFAGPKRIAAIGVAYIALYYFVSACFIANTKSKAPCGILKKGSLLDRLTSLVWATFAIFLIGGLIYQCVYDQLSLKILCLFYILFIFCFGFLFALWEWHFSGSLDGVSLDEWVAEIQYIVVSIQSQASLGYTTVTPQSTFINLLACLQSLLGQFFVVVILAKAVEHF